MRQSFPRMHGVSSARVGNPTKRGLSLAFVGHIHAEVGWGISQLAKLGQTEGSYVRQLTINGLTRRSVGVYSAPSQTIDRFAAAQYKYPKFTISLTDPISRLLRL